MQTEVSIIGARFFAKHGFYAEERLCGHHFEIDGKVCFDLADPLAEDLTKTVNYQDLITICQTVMDEPHMLLETVCAKILNHWQQRFPFITSAEISLSKLGPQLGIALQKTKVTMRFGL